ncbi:EamA family transporter [Aliidiomarina sedimenti]|uniref:EamA family transporter n=1 Tax=Aliidiomarina sedimenti TaxID=1933879 RepID=A0ABY0C2L5_9GAMM|nr:EamA family transporter [Aliidiomarina sedimenti]RUO32069.1 EamA family transporter [Aliidiomarina sedimenti]
MLTLSLVTLLWAFSFSLIGVYLSADVDAYIAVFIRMLLAFLLLLPFLKTSYITKRKAISLTFLGAIQIGIMYILLYHAFNYISIAEVLLFTVFTPLYITLTDELLINKKALPWQWWGAALLAVCGAAIIRYENISEGFIYGFLLIQGANICFALGQVGYKRLPLGNPKEQRQVYALFFLGALLVSAIAALLFADWSRSPQTTMQWGVLLWLGLVASGVGYLAWSIASKQVNTGQLATMNNVLIPAGLLINFIFWGSDINWIKLFLGGIIIGLGVLLAGSRVRLISKA